jgi:hypothetical protein
MVFSSPDLPAAPNFPAADFSHPAGIVNTFRDRKRLFSDFFPQLLIGTHAERLGHNDRLDGSLGKNDVTGTRARMWWVKGC